MSSKCIVLDGLDAAGKSLMAKKLKVHLQKMLGQKKVFLTAEPSKSFFGIELRKLLKNEKNPKENANKFLGLYIKDRQLHLKKEIIPELKKGKTVLCDRYKYSTIVYQSVQGVSEKKIIQLHKNMLVPDLVLVFDVPVKTALKRIIKSSRKSFDVFEQEKFLKKVRKKFLNLPKILPKENIKVINANRSKQRVFSDLKKEVGKILF